MLLVLLIFPSAISRSSAFLFFGDATGVDGQKLGAAQEAKGKGKDSGKGKGSSKGKGKGKW